MSLENNNIIKEELLEDLYQYLINKGVHVQQNVSYTLISDDSHTKNSDFIEDKTPVAYVPLFNPNVASHINVDSVDDSVSSDQWDYTVHEPLANDNPYDLLAYESYDHMLNDDFFSDYSKDGDKLFTAPKKQCKSAFMYKYQCNRADVYGYPFTVRNIRRRHVLLKLFIVLLLVTGVATGGVYAYRTTRLAPIVSYNGVTRAEHYFTFPYHKITGEVIIPTPTGNLPMMVSGLYSLNELNLIELHDDQHQITILSVPGHKFIHSNLPWASLGFIDAVDSTMWGEMTGEVNSVPFNGFYNLPGTIESCLHTKILNRDENMTMGCFGLDLTLKENGVDVANKIGGVLFDQLHVTDGTPVGYPVFTTKIVDLIHGFDSVQLLYPVVYPVTPQNIVCSRSQCTVTQTVSLHNGGGENYRNITSMKIMETLYTRKEPNLGSCTVSLTPKLNLKQTFTCTITGLTGQLENPKTNHKTLILINSKNYSDKWLQAVSK